MSVGEISQGMVICLVFPKSAAIKISIPMNNSMFPKQKGREQWKDKILALLGMLIS